MKNWFRKISLILMLVLVTGLFTGCSAGSTVATTLTINEDLSGTRVMDLVIDESVFKEYFSGTIEDLNAAITEGCPSDLTWAYDDSTGVKKYTFTLNFTSPQDYKTKVDTLIGEGSDVALTITKSDSVWASGVMVDESFSSGDILSWLKTLVVEKGFVSSSNSSEIFELSGNTILFGGVEYTDRDSRISIDEIEYLNINSIDLLTDAKEYDCYDKTIVISIPESSMEIKGDEIKTWLEARVPSGATGEWSTQDTNTIYTVSKEDMTGEELQAFLNHYFDSDRCVVEQQDVRENMSPFSFNIELFEYVDFSNYIVGDMYYYITVNNYVKGENGYVGGRYLEDLQYNSELEDVSQYEGYQYGGKDITEDNLTMYKAYFQKLYRVEKVNVETNVGFTGGLSRTISFVLNAEPTDEEKASIMEKINALGLAYDKEIAGNEDETVTEDEGVAEDETVTEDGATTEEEGATEENTTPQWNVKVSEKMQEDGYTIIIEQKGSREEIQASTKALFGSEGDLYSVKDFAFYKFKYDVAIFDEFELGDFVDYLTDDVDARYTLKAGFGTDTEFASIESARTDGREVTLKEGVLDGVSMTVYGTQFNLWAVFFYLMIVVAIACVVIAVLKSGLLSGLSAGKKAKQAEEVPAAKTQEIEQPVVVQPESVEETSAQTENVRFCGNCGAKYSVGAAFCPECGNKLEE